MQIVSIYYAKWSSFLKLRLFVEIDVPSLAGGLRRGRNKRRPWTQKAVDWIKLNMIYRPFKPQKLVHFKLIKKSHFIYRYDLAF